MSTVDRREFLKASALAAATAAAARASGISLPILEPQAAPSSSAQALRWDKAPCRFCGTGCHVMVGTENGRVVAIQGDQKAEVNKGLLCVKGYHVGLALYGRDRLTQPMLRTQGRLVPISWDKALDIVADRIAADPGRFAIYGSGQWTIGEGYAANKFIKAGLGSNLIDANPRLCMASAVTGFISTFGVDEPPGVYDDLDRCDVAILWGNNMAEMHPVLFSRLVDRRARGEKVVIIDLTTRRTRTSELADQVLFFKPQGDLAIANGIAHQLVKNGTCDTAFVAAHCNFRRLGEPGADGAQPDMLGVPMTFEEYAKALEPYTPQRVEELSGVPAESIVMLGDLFGRRDRRINSLWCMGMNQHTRGTAINCLVHGIHLLSGHFGKPGDAATSLTGQPSACGTAREVGTLCHLLPGGLSVTNPGHRAIAEKHWNLEPGRLSGRIGLHAVELFKRFSTPTDQGGDITTVWVQVTNPAHTIPDLNHSIRRKAQLADKFLIVSDVYPTATTELADLVLPSAMWVEKNGMYGNSERRTQHWFKMVEPPGEARDDAWQMIAVSRRLFDRGVPGMRDKDGRWLFHTADSAGKEIPIWEWKRYYSDTVVDERLFDEYRAFSRHKHKDLAPYREYVKARGLRWPVVQNSDGEWKETRWRFTEGSDPYVAKGKGFQFYHSVTKDDRALIWFRPYEPPPEVPDAEYPFWLCTGRVLEHWHSGTMTRRIPQLHRAMPKAYVEMNHLDARALGVRSGEMVTVRSRRGEVDLPVWLGGRGDPRPGEVFVPFFDENPLINRVTLAAYDPYSKQPDYKKCAVAVVPKA
ncbi:MAG: twin-arginine translocation signal domain-containing protein [Phycisphaerae bacterium]|nr:twin-arginine translocation signal domain-containing protein [Phycisphaerae bacterium]